MTVKVCGNSHIVAIRKGYNSLEGEHPSLKIFPLGGANFDNVDFSTLKEEGVGFNVDLYTELLKKFTGKGLMDDSGIWGLSIGSHFPKVYSHALLRKYQPSKVADADVRPLSRGVMEAVVRSNQKYVIQFFENLKQKGIKFFVILAPPPPANFHVIEERGIKKETIAYFDSVARAWFKSELSKLDVDFLDAPKNTCDKDGFLLPEYKLDVWNNGKPDPHHANPKYGVLVVKQIFELLKTYGNSDEQD